MVTLHVGLLLLLVLIPEYQCMLQNLYCGLDNCYEILGVKRESEKAEIIKSYRKLARKWHPDRYRTKKEKEDATAMFQKIANAYEILKEDETRNDYNYMLDNPEEWYTHYYSYYRKRVTPKVDVRIVIAVTITVISAIQYWSSWNNYNLAISYLVTVPKYRLQATEIAKKEGLLNDKRKKDRTKTREELKLEEEAILKKIIEEKMDIRGGYSRPSYYNVLWLQLLFSPYYLVTYIYWYLSWIWKFNISKQEYGETEKHYIIRKQMKLSQAQWDAQEQHDINEFMRRELWIKENFNEWKEEKDEEMRAQLANNSRYKSYKRFMKKGGAGQMTFGPE